MTCIHCNHDTAKRFGFYGRRHIQRYRCNNCRLTFTDPVPKVGSHYTDPEVAAKAISMMLEGMSLRAISRLTGLHLQTITALMFTAANRAQIVLNSYVQNIQPKFVQMDELWGFIGGKDKNISMDAPREWGSAWLWLALDSETKLIISHLVGDRSAVSAYAFIADLRQRTVGRFQITTDSLNAYTGALHEYFENTVDYAQLHKIYSNTVQRARGDWYGNGRVIGAVPHLKIGRPDFSKISTSHVERVNLSVRMHMRRFTRLTNAFSKKRDNLRAAATLYVAFYNFCRVHQALTVTPAMQAGLTDHVWTVNELLAYNSPVQHS